MTTTGRQDRAAVLAAVVRMLGTWRCGLNTVNGIAYRFSSDGRKVERFLTVSKRWEVSANHPDASCDKCHRPDGTPVLSVVGGLMDA